MPMQREDIVKYVNEEISSTWEAALYPQFEGKSAKDALKLTGARLNGPKAGPYRKSLESNALPSNFDWRKQGNCVHSVLNQGQCGSCWAFGATEALSDRFCIASKGSVDVVLSPEQLVSCDSNDYGCQGGKFLKSYLCFCVS